MTTPIVQRSERAVLIEAAIQRYLDASRPVPLEWIAEYLESILRNHQECQFLISIQPKRTP